MAKCKHCGREFKPLTPTGQYCCLSCYKAGPTLLLAPAKPKKPAEQAAHDKKTYRGRLKKKYRQWALYKGETFLASGTIEEISEQTGKPYNHLLGMTSPLYKRRTAGSTKCLHMTDLSYPDEPDDRPEKKAVCLICGKEYMSHGGHQKYCSEECAKQAKLRKKADEAGLSSDELRVKKKNDALRKLSIEEINAKARRQGLSYGKMQAQKKLEQLHEEMCGK